VRENLELRQQFAHGDANSERPQLRSRTDCSGSSRRESQKNDLLDAEAIGEAANGRHAVRAAQAMAQLDLQAIHRLRTRLVAYINGGDLIESRHIF